MRRLARDGASEAERVLAEELVKSLTDEQRCVLTGLAAYGTPVTGEQLEDLLEGERPPGEIDTTLKDLTRIHVVSRAANRYYISALQVQDALTQVLGLTGRHICGAAPRMCCPRAARKTSGGPRT